MDTRFWGPPGWRLLHLISVSDAPQRNPTAVHDFFTLIAYVLPCKFCRASYSQYIEEDPVPEVAELAGEKGNVLVAKWLWALHNKVNAKLRSQHLPTAPDPPFDSVLKVYKERLGAGCTRTEFEGWDFLFAIAENHPFSRNGRNTLSMPDTPPKHELKGGDMEANRWNLMKPEVRMKYYRRFWEVLPHVLPYKEWETVWESKSPGKALASRTLLLRWLWKRRCTMEKSLELLNRTEFYQVCSRLAEARSGCGKKKKAKTCRRQKINNKKKTYRKIYH